MKLYANLHTHSNHSDGPYSPEKLVQIAKAEGYKAIALTDHDTATGFAQLEAACLKEGMEYIFCSTVEDVLKQALLIPKEPEVNLEEPKQLHLPVESLQNTNRKGTSREGQYQ